MIDSTAKLPNFFSLNPGYHVIEEILTMHLKARYTKYHHVQSPFEDVQIGQ